MENPSFFLESVVRDRNELQNFEGPLSLILMLLQKNKIEIRDIKIGDILDQYLAYLEKMQGMDLEVASEFVQMASYLLYIKTKTLLVPEPEELTELELLMSSLEQLKAKDVYAGIQKITPELKKAAEQGSLYFTKLPEPLPDAAKEYVYRHEPVELLEAVYRIFSRGGKSVADESVTSAMPQRIVYSVKDKSRQLLSLLRTGPMSLNTLYSVCGTKSELIATFVSVLELCSMGSVSVIRGEDDYEIRFTGGDVDEIIEKIVE